MFNSLKRSLLLATVAAICNGNAYGKHSDAYRAALLSDPVPHGNIIEQRGGGEVSTYAYDPQGRLSTAQINLYAASGDATPAVFEQIDYRYDLSGNRTNLTAGGLSVDYAYNAEERLTSLSFSVDSGPPREITLSYDDAQRLTGISYPNGVNASFGLDAESRVTNIVHGAFIDHTIHRNDLGFKTTECIDAGLTPSVPDTRRTLRTHDDADRLTAEKVQCGTNWTDVTHSYTDNGGLSQTVSTDTSVVANVSYSYDYADRLSEVNRADATVDYLYDASGARVGRISGTATNYYIVDHSDPLKRPVAETDDSGSITRYYIWTPRRLLAHIDLSAVSSQAGTTGPPVVVYYHQDELGSTLALTDASGTATDRFAHTPYGRTTHVGATETPYQWLGGYGVAYDDEAALHLTRFRAYSARMRRFISPDPLGIDAFPNLYAYANLNPLAFIDPWGLCAEPERGFFGNAWDAVAGGLSTAWQHTASGVSTAWMYSSAFAEGFGGQVKDDFLSGEMGRRGVAAVSAYGKVAVGIGEAALGAKATVGSGGLAAAGGYAMVVDGASRTSGGVTDYFNLFRSPQNQTQSGDVIETGARMALGDTYGPIARDVTTAVLTAGTSELVRRSAEQAANTTAQAIARETAPKGGKAYRVMSQEELAGAKTGKYADSPYVNPSQSGKKWVWQNKQQAKSWKTLMEKGGEKPVITEIPTQKPLIQYDAFPHETPPGPAHLVPFEDLGPATPLR